jgi:hypothetical protein
VWRIEPSRIDDGTARWSCLAGTDRALTFEQVAHAWTADSAFRRFWIESLGQVPFDAYCWECPPIQESTRSRRFECVFLSSPSLAGMPVDTEAFAEHFRRDREVVTFGNLGGDALLVVPCPEESGADFSHLGSFTKTASPSLQQALWNAVGQALESRIGARPIWLSTAGHGVAWLHVRLDTRPKYYRYAPYRNGR